MSTVTEKISSSPTNHDLLDLRALLRDAVEGEASVGFTLPLVKSDIVEFWSGVLRDISAGQRVALVAREAGAILGDVPLELATRTNSRHRAEVQKLLVRRSERGRGIGGALIEAAEKATAEIGRAWLVLDTSATGNAIGLYQRCGDTKCGVIPRFARDPDGPLIDTIIYYKELTPP